MWAGRHLLLAAHGRTLAHLIAQNRQANRHQLAGE
jgi:antitoxin (DNA-binding transcriptional repressor) of toxin-antitoxin stability system